MFVSVRSRGSEMAVTLSLLVTYTAVTAVSVAQRNYQCQKLTANSICTDLAYNQTFMPNLLNNANQEHAVNDMQPFKPYLERGCTDLKPFLCYLYFPKCTDHGEPIKPCRKLCLSALYGCEAIMNKFGFQWPEYLECHKFPLDGCVDDSRNYTSTTVVPAKQAPIAYSEYKHPERLASVTPKKLQRLGGETQKDPEYCHRGFQIASKFHTCWEENSAPLSKTEAGEELTPEMLRDYASHMCGVVKPMALKCLRNKLSECSEVEKIIKTADSSGGACQGDHLNPFFQKHIIDFLKPTPLDSPCFKMDSKAYQCYASAGEKAISNQDSHIDVSMFHKAADKFFGNIWECHIDLFKGMKDVCPNWQIPMLLSLQKTAMPYLFGMKLNNHQVKMLELGSLKKEDASQQPEVGGPVSQLRSLLLLRVVSDQAEARPGDVLVQLTAGRDKPPVLNIDPNTTGNSFIEEVRRIVNAKGGANMRVLRAKIREQKKRQKEIKAFLKQVKKITKKKKGDGKKMLK